MLNQTASLTGIPNELRDEIFQYVLIELLPCHNDWATLELFRRSFTTLQLISKRINLRALIFTELFIKAKTLYHKAHLSLAGVYRKIPEARDFMTYENYGRLRRPRHALRMCTKMTLRVLGEIIIDCGHIQFSPRWGGYTGEFHKQFIRLLRKRVLPFVPPLPRRDRTQVTILFHVRPRGTYGRRIDNDVRQHSRTVYICNRLEYQRNSGWIELERSQTEHWHCGPVKSAAGGSVLTETRCIRTVRGSLNECSVRDSDHDLSQTKVVHREWTRRVGERTCSCDLQPDWLLRRYLERDWMMRGRILKQGPEFGQYSCKGHSNQ